MTDNHIDLDFTYIQVFDPKEYTVDDTLPVVFWHAAEFLIREELEFFDRRYNGYYITGDSNYHLHRTNNLELIYFPIHDYAATRIWDNIPLNIDKKTHTHLCLNGKDIGHRRYIASLLNDTGILTYLEIKDMDYFFKGELGFTKEQLKQANTLCNPVRPFDSTNLIRNLPDDIFHKTCYSVIGETAYQTEYKTAVKGFLTEKTYSALANNHPFVLAAPVGRLRQLHDEGYITFSEWWDESYDDVASDGKRLTMIGDVISKLQGYSLDDWKIILDEMKDVLRHNRELLYSIDIDERITKRLTNKVWCY